MKTCRFLLLAAALLVAGCDVASSDEDRGRFEPRDLTAAEKAVVAADNRFGFELLGTLAEAAPGDNVFISPISVSMALGMTVNGASGDTYDAMVRTLGKDHLDGAAVNASYRGLKDMLTGLDPEVTVEIANSIWYRMGFPVLASFLEAGETWFDAEIREDDFDDPAAVDRVNGWAEDNTHGLVKDVISEIDPAVVMLLMNAVYFKGTWQYQFDPDDTTEGPFTTGRCPRCR
jgi:serpin B